MTVKPKEQICIGHICTKCDKDLYPEQIRSSIFAALIITAPLLLATIFGIWREHKIADQLMPPFCYQEKWVNSTTTQRIEVRCPATIGHDETIK